MTKICLFDASLPYLNQISGDSVCITDFINGDECETSATDIINMTNELAERFNYHTDHKKVAVVFSSNSAETLCLILSLIKNNFLVILKEEKFDETFQTETIPRLNPDYIFYQRTENLSADLKTTFSCLPATDLSNLHLTPLQKSRAIKRDAIVFDDDALVIFTSGSTGKQKGVVFKTSALEHFTHVKGNNQRSIQPITLVPHSITHISSLLNALIGIQCGLNTVLLNKFDPQLYLKYLHLNQLQFFSCTTTMMRILLKELKSSPTEDIPNIRNVALFGEHADTALLNDVKLVFNCKILPPGYGMTETGGGVLGTYDLRDDIIPDGTCGKILHSTDQIKLIDQKTLKPSNQGTAWVKSPRASSRYLDDDLNTSETFKDGWVNTSDLMKRDENGFYFHLGRADDMVMLGGQKIFVKDIEKLISSHTCVQQCFIILVDNTSLGKEIIAFVSTSHQEANFVGQLRRYCLDKMPSANCPSKFIILHEFPTLASGKLDRKQLRKLIETPNDQVDDLSPRQDKNASNDIKQSVLSAYSHVFAKPVTEDDNFHDLGGDSLMAVLLSLALSDALNRDVSIQEIYDNADINNFLYTIQK